MCDQHNFQFDVDLAYGTQLLSVLEASPGHPIQAPDAPTTFGVYVIYLDGFPVYVGQARNLRNRLRDHRRKIEGREGIEIEHVT